MNGSLDGSTANQIAAHADTISLLTEIATTQRETRAVAVENNRLLHEIVDNQRAPLEGTAGSQTNPSQSNLQQSQESSSVLPRNFHLRPGDVTRIGQNPIGGSASMEIWEGLYLGREKVAIKVIRSPISNPESLQRFKREVTVWSDVLRIDDGKHVLPFYGFCEDDGPAPYMVSAWPSKGTAINYVKKYPDVDYRRLIRGIGEGIVFLHSMTPPIVHGNIKGCSIVIDDGGKPLIADFGVSRVVENITGEPFSQSNGPDSYRWLAPELCEGEGMLSTSSDVYSFAMTILELITNQQPYYYIKHAPAAMLKATKGIRPQRPTESHIIQRGLDDNLWNLLMDCWGDSQARPSIRQVLVRLQ